jgi:long-chain acyl-CoA synthetase
VQKLKSKDELKLSVKFEPTFVYITPTQIRFISSFFVTLPSTLNVYIGGGRLNFQTREMAKQIFPNAIVHLFYGSSETSFITISDEFTPVGSVGKAFPNVEIKLEKSGPNKNRIWVKSNYLFLKYAEGSNKNLVWQDGWLTIGEYGKIDRDGYLFLLNENNSRITIADKTMETYEIEDKLKMAENVIDAAVWKIENKLSDYRIVAAVATNGEVHSDRLYDALKEINKIFKPKKIYKISLNEWPLLPSGKTDLRALKSHYHER